MQVIIVKNPVRRMHLAGLLLLLLHGCHRDAASTMASSMYRLVVTQNASLYLQNIGKTVSQEEESKFLFRMVDVNESYFEYN